MDSPSGEHPDARQRQSPPLYHQAPSQQFISQPSSSSSSTPHHEHEHEHDNHSPVDCPASCVHAADTMAGPPSPWSTPSPAASGAFYSSAASPDPNSSTGFPMAEHQPRSAASAYSTLDFEDEESLNDVPSITDDGFKHSRLPTTQQHDNYKASSSRPLGSQYSAHAVPDRSLRSGAGYPDILSNSEFAASEVLHQPQSLLFSLPPELLDTIVSFLEPWDVARVSATCHALRRYTESELYWRDAVQHHVPSNLTSTGPFSSFRDLYAAHDPVWFLPKYKIWFCDRDLTGKLIIARYDQHRGCIEGYQLLAISKQTTVEHWPADQNVVIHDFEPKVKLHLDKPVLQFRAEDRERRLELQSHGSGNRFLDEMPMNLDDRQESMYSNFLLTRPLDSQEAEDRLAADWPYSLVWPPPAVPARHHVAGVRSGQPAGELSPADRPRRRSEVSEQTFRIRQWLQMGGTGTAPGLMGQAGRFAGMLQVLIDAVPSNGPTVERPFWPSIHIGEEVITYSTLDPSLYTPTPTKPWRGIWVGDYSGHGCEFLLIHQPDDEPASDEELGLVRDSSESDEQWEERRLEARIYRGRLEGIKLTGDPNVPRGERTFVAHDLGQAGHVGVATDPPFSGARVVRSRGHVAATGFLRDKYIESQLLLINENRLAQYWVGFGHISYFERVNIDDFVTP